MILCYAPMTMTATQGQSTKAARQGRSDCWTDDAAAFWRVNSLSFLPYKHVGGFGFGAIEAGAPEFHCTYYTPSLKIRDLRGKCYERGNHHARSYPFDRKLPLVPLVSHICRNKHSLVSGNNILQFCAAAIAPFRECVASLGIWKAEGGRVEAGKGP